MLPDSKRRLIDVRSKVKSNISPDVVNLQNLVESAKHIELESSQPEFWEDQKRAQDSLSELNKLKELIKRARKWTSDCDEVEEIIEIATCNKSESG